MRGCKPNFENYAIRVLEKKRLRAPKTYVTARSHFRRLSEFFKGVPLHHITDAQWLDYCLWRRASHPKARLYDDRKHLNTVLRAAYFAGIIPRRIKLTILDHKTNAGREITSLELGKLYQHASPALTLQIEIALKMGLRLREMLYLRWDQFDWDKRLIRLLTSDTKTRRARVVPINPDVYDRLRARFICKYSNYVFPRRSDLTKPQETNRRSWELVKFKADVKCRWHDLRHTCATLMIRRGIPVSTASKVLGMSQKVLTEIYAHLNEDDLANVGRVMSDGGKDCG